MTAPVPFGRVIDYAPDRFDDDVADAAEHGLQVLRFDIAWYDAQPREASWNGDVFERTHMAIATAHDAGLEAWLRLLQPQIPHWFDDEGGFADANAAARAWPRWVDRVAEELGDEVDGWVPFETPYALARRVAAAEPRRVAECVDTLVVAWRDAWRLLRGGPPVATSLDVAVVEPRDGSPEAAEAARREDQLRTGVWMRALTTGEVVVPGRADRTLDDLAGGCDIVGIAARTQTERLLYRVAEQVPDTPLAVTFKPTATTDAQRSEELEHMTAQVNRAAEELPIAWVTTV